MCYVLERCRSRDQCFAEEAFLLFLLLVVLVLARGRHVNAGHRWQAYS